MSNTFLFSPAVDPPKLADLREEQLVVTAHNPEQDEVVHKDSGDCWSVQLWAEIDQAVPQTARAVHLPAQL